MQLIIITIDRYTPSNVDMYNNLFFPGDDQWWFLSIMTAAHETEECIDGVPPPTIAQDGMVIAPMQPSRVTLGEEGVGALPIFTIKTWSFNNT